MRPVEEVLDRLEGVRESNGSWKALCPAHDDREPSLSVSESNEGKAILHCFTGCDTEEIVAELGLEMKDLFQSRNGRTSKKDLSSIPSKTTATVQPCNLTNYAEAKALPVEFLQKHGLRDQKYQGQPAVRIPYLGVDGTESAVRFRIALEKSEEGDDRFRWRTGSKAQLYGLWRLESIKKAGYVVLVEGESDTQTLWHHRLPALGIPGASNWKPEWSEYLEGIEKIYVVIEPDQGGNALKDKLAGSAAIQDRLHLVALGEHKDVSGLHLAAPESFKEGFSAALRDATYWPEQQRLEAQAAAREAWDTCRELAHEPDILDRFARDLARSGVAGESRVAKLLYLAVTSRQLGRPVSVAVKGPSSGGKSYLTEQVLRFFPESSYYALTAMSEHALAYSDEPLSHRFLVIYEAAGMNSDFQTYLIRSLLSEGKVRYETVEKTSEGMKPRLIERAGPTGLLITTTLTRLHPENETRLLSLTVTDTQDQTRDIMAALAEEAAGPGPDLEQWLALQEWIEAAENRVSIPYSRELAELIPPVAVRLRRDFGAILNLIRAHAILHQAGRERDNMGRVVASVEDYAKVRALVADLVSEGLEATVPATVRETVEVLKALKDDEDHVTIKALADELKLDKSAAWRRVRAAMDRGYIENLEDRRGRPARLVPGDDLPADIEILPRSEQLHTKHLYHSEAGLSHGCTVAGDFEGVKKNSFCEAENSPEEKVFVSTPSSATATVQPRHADREEFVL